MATIIQILLLGPWVSIIESKKMRVLAVRPNTEDLNFMKELIEDGKVAPIIGKTYPLSEVPEAIGYVGGGRVQGKVVISV